MEIIAYIAKSFSRILQVRTNYLSLDEGIICHILLRENEQGWNEGSLSLFVKLCTGFYSVLAVEYAKKSCRFGIYSRCESR